MYAAKMK